MTDFLIEAAAQPWAYVMVVIFCLLDGFFPPIPSETLVVGVAALAATHGWSALSLLVLTAAIGAFLGDNIAYLIGRHVGTTRFAWLRRPMMQRALSKAGTELEQRPISMILVARFLPVARVAVNLTAGATRYKRGRFVAVSALSATLWAVYSVAIGALAGSWLREHPLLGLIGAMVVAGLLGIVLDKILRVIRTRRVPAKQAPEPEPEPVRSLAAANLP